ncbi:MAG: putative lipid II flippase FtsW [Oscillospiraceae bacterium]|nr:putative lipid II flippase FtsW [Oscillospiraceae bacterium]
MNKRQAFSETNKPGTQELRLTDDHFPNWRERELSARHIKTAEKAPGVDKPMLVITLVILLIGVIMVLSASFARGSYTAGGPLRLFLRQAIFAVTGIILMLIVSKISTRTISRWSMQLLFVSIILLVLVLIIGIEANGAKRWIGIGGENGILTFQPSEIAKLALILSFAQMICKIGGNKMKTFKFGVVPFAIIIGIVVILLRFQSHMSAMIIVTFLAAIMMFAGGTRLRWFLMVVAVLVSMVSGLIYFQLRAAAPQLDAKDVTIETIVDNVDFSGFGYQGRRINAWLDPDGDPLGDGFQIRQSLNAIGSGGFLGQGLGQSRQKYLYLPEEHNDYIFSIVCEELGFVGAMLIIMLFILLIIRGYWLAMNANDKFGSLIVIGITSLLALQVFLNIAVVTNMLPATGISLPFFSYGGTALWLQLIQIGIILSVSKEIPAPAEDKTEDAGFAYDPEY